ncbi:hypothetical protein PHMEG_00023038 [Phytophthora megakarya]|uniref:Uncharacterized protein n=1 Tax=Phytophthora megakarya TaxID=4795 RepID=A0A225VIM8_9STRA|nr:hypothetical protein PHMEG_00023038 [Phytophthora megakarya]
METQRVSKFFNHPSFEMEMGDASVAATGSLLPWVHQKVSNRYAWFERVHQVASGTLRANMEAVTKAVEKRIGEEMSDTFGLLWMAVVDAAGWFDAETHMAALVVFLPVLRLARLMGVPLVGCARHRLSLVVRTLLEPHEAELEQVQSLMKRLGTLTQAAKLRADDEDLAELMPSPAANRRLKALLVELADVESVSMKLQSEDLNLLDTRDLLNGLLEVKPSLRHYLAPSADIVAAPEFDDGAPFDRETSAAAAATEETTKVGFADRILKRRKVQDNASAYVQLNAIPPTSNAVERLFSIARMILRYERNRLSR